MAPSPPPLPSLQSLPYNVFVDGAMGYLCGRLGQTNAHLTATIFAIRSLANILFYHVANYVVGAKDLNSQKVFLITSTLVNMICLIALREINLIGQSFSCFLGLAALGYVIHRASYIQNQERQSILEKESA